MRTKDVDDLKDQAVRNKLKELIDWLDEKDCEDFFGTEGWRHDIGWTE